MKSNDIITAEELIDIIRTHGAGDISVDGCIPEPYDDAAEFQLDGSERFRVIIAYWGPVQFHLITQDADGADTIDGDYRAIVTTGLKGRCDYVQGWIA